jgi:Zn-dependent protease/CBS domain-containing protein
LIILALLTFSIASLFPALTRAYFGESASALPPYAYWFMGLIAALAFFVCILLHELGHAIVARLRGMPIRGITLFLFGGVAELDDEPPSAATEFLMAIAGPVVSVILGVGFALLTGIGYYGGWPPPVLMVLGYLAFINLLVLAFNLIPAFPLDGGRVFRSILWGATGDLRRATYWASRAGQAFAWLLIVWGVMQFFTGNCLGGIWSGLIGLFLNTAALGGYQQVLIRQALQGEPVRRFMNPDPIVVPPALDLLRWVEEFVYRYHHKAFPVVSDGHLEGCITTQALAGIPRAEWDQHTVGEVMRRDLQTITIPPDADALDALGRMRRTGLSRLLVAERGRRESRPQRSRFRRGLQYRQPPPPPAGTAGVGVRAVPPRRRGPGSRRRWPGTAAAGPVPAFAPSRLVRACCEAIPCSFPRAPSRFGHRWG